MKPVFRVTEARDRKENTAVTSGSIGGPDDESEFMGFASSTACSHQTNLGGSTVWDTEMNR
jgi:hypothetical protein